MHPVLQLGRHVLPWVVDQLDEPLPTLLPASIVLGLKPVRPRMTQASPAASATASLAATHWPLHGIASRA